MPFPAAPTTTTAPPTTTASRAATTRPGELALLLILTWTQTFSTPLHYSTPPHCTTIAAAGTTAAAAGTTTAAAGTHTPTYPLTHVPYIDCPKLRFGCG